MSYKAVMVILNYNDKKVTQKLAQAVVDYSCLERVIIVDNCSTDDSYEYLRRVFDSPTVDVIKTNKNGGYAKGNNFGIKYAITHYNPDCIFVANPDIFVEEKTLQNIMGVMEVRDEYGVLAPIVNDGLNVWNLPGFTGMIESLFLVWFNLDKKRIKERLLKSTKHVEAVGVVEGSFFCIRREDYEAIGGFDERTFLYAEEIILSKRLQSINKKVGVLTGERYDHLHSTSIKKAYNSSKCKAFPNFYKSFRVYNKNYLKTGPIKDTVFFICYKLAYLERFIYDCIKSKGNEGK